MHHAKYLLLQIIYSFFHFYFKASEATPTETTSVDENYDGYDTPDLTSYNYGPTSDYRNTDNVTPESPISYDQRVVAPDNVYNTVEFPYDQNPDNSYGQETGTYPDRGDIGGNDVTGTTFFFLFLFISFCVYLFDISVIKLLNTQTF